MMDALHRDLGSWGVPKDRLHFEAFGPATVGQQAKNPPLEDSSNTFTIKFLRSQKSLQWTSDTSSLLDLAESNGIRVDSGCRSGNCGTCMTAIRQGEVDYRDIPSEMPDEGTCLLCTAVPRADLELDA